MLRILCVLVAVLLSSPSQAANIFYLSTSGNDSNSCTTATNIGTPKRTLDNALGCLASGDTLRMRAGTYSSGSLGGIPAGGGETSRTTVEGYDADGNRAVTVNGSIETPSAGGHNYLLFRNFRLNGSGHNNVINVDCGGTRDSTSDSSVWVRHSHHITFDNLEIFGSSATGIHFPSSECDPSNAGANQLLNSTIRHTGSNTTLDHGIYACSSDNIVDHNIFDNNAACGVHFYCSQHGGTERGNNNVIRNNDVRNNTRAVNCHGINVGSGDNNLIYNNVVHDNKNGLTVRNQGGNTRVYNNTVMNNQGDGIDNQQANAGSNTFTNNITFGNGNSNNFGGASTANNFTGNPQVDSSFHLTSSSPQPPRNSGTNLSTTFTTDFEGTVRPSSGAWDIGADQFGGTSCGCPTGCTCTVCNVCDTQPGQTTPLAWWKFEEGTGTTASDAADSNTATLQAGATWGAGRVGAFAAQLDGADDVIALTGSILTAFGSDQTICLWAQPASATTKHSSGFEQTLLNLSADASNGVRMNLQTDATTPSILWVTILSGGTPLAAGTTTTVFQTGTWVHLCYTRAGATLAVYVNGASQTTVSNNRYDPEGTADVLGARTATTGNFQGKLDEVKIWNRALSAGEVTNEFTGTGSGSPVGAIARHRRITQ